ncbi:hypothetical protein HGO23_15395 [Xenorhabdus budapestensis]|uniref:Uncharacterized protein n=1 Tax=Xenorhabdus budapestensis TaxID=290110 RepID=A0ABX7VHW3_XENBU|nr:hypothetical protein [Xenorhabdus budapestensis]QTL39202.1 hypothetical protein HGO23_15395 [Xenorhabdus budapestensis]
MNYNVGGYIYTPKNHDESVASILRNYDDQDNSEISDARVLSVTDTVDNISDILSFIGTSFSTVAAGKSAFPLIGNKKIFNITCIHIISATSLQTK